jgi:hypothetical protein
VIKLIWCLEGEDHLGTSLAKHRLCWTCQNGLAGELKLTQALTVFGVASPLRNNSKSNEWLPSCCTDNKYSGSMRFTVMAENTLAEIRASNIFVNLERDAVVGFEVGSWNTRKYELADFFWRPGRTTARRYARNKRLTFIGYRRAKSNHDYGYRVYNCQGMVEMHSQLTFVESGKRIPLWATWFLLRL